MNGTKNNQRSLAIFFCLLLFFVWTQTVLFPYFFGKRTPLSAPLSPGVSSTQNDPAVTQSPSSQAASNQGALPPPVAQQATPAQIGAYPTEAEIAATGEIIVKTETFEISISLLGGRFTKVLLNNYQQSLKSDSPRLNLIEHEEPFPYPLGVYSGNDSDARVNYRLVSPAKKAGIFEVHPSAKESVILEGTFPDGRIIRKTFSFSGGGYLIGIDVVLTGSSSQGYRLDLEWTKLIKKDSPTLLDPYNTSGYVWFDGQKAFREAFSKVKTEREDLGNVSWVSESDKYFVSTLLSPNEPAPAHIIQHDQLFAARITGQNDRASFTLFTGPKSYELLQRVGFELHRNIDFGWAGFVSAPLLFLLQFLYKFFGNYGVAIVGLTIIVRGALFPLNSAAFKQMKAMQKLQPEMKRIRDTIKDRQQQQLETMNLYKKHGLNPFGGCFPMLLQFPIFIGLYYALLLAIDLRHAPFAFWIQDLSAPETLMIGGVGIPVMVILWVCTMLAQQWMMPSTDPVQKKMMMIMPIFMGFMLRLCPAGVTLYWLTSNIISIGQQTALNKKGVSASAQMTALVSVGVLGLAYLLSKIG